MATFDQEPASGSGTGSMNGSDSDNPATSSSGAGTPGAFGRAAREIPRSLGWRMVVILVCTLVGLLGASDWLALKLHRAHLTHMLEERAVGMAETIISSTHFSMLENDRRHLEQILENIGRRESVRALRLINPKGEVVFSQNEAEIGSTSDMQSQVCQGCHSGGRMHAPDGLRDGLVQYSLPSGEQTLGLGIPVLNEASCSTASCHYHPPNQAVLGILDLELSTSELEAAIVDARKQMVAVAIATVLLISCVIGWLAWRIVHRPLHTVLRGIHTLASGDRAHRIPNNLPAEAGELAAAFNVMSERLGTAQLELENWNETLEARIEEKTKELERTRDQMVFTEKMASLGKLAAIVAHEINNPLAGVLVYAKLVRRRLPKLISADATERETKAKEVDETLATIEAETARCGDIVRNLLLFSRQGILEHEPTDVNAIVDRAVKLVQHRADLGNVSLVRELGTGIPELVCDRSEFQQALLAMVLNALDAMPDGGTLTLRTHFSKKPASKTPNHVGAPDGVITVEIQDTGIGIPEEIRARIFEPFFSTKSEGAGTGLGLAVTYGIVQRHGGTIDVHSKVGHGTTFCLKFPLRRPEDAVTTPPTPESELWVRGSRSETPQSDSTPSGESLAGSTSLSEGDRS
ncbi:MAG: HAMP domain-containing protein [Candidatus Eisenbacteria bacterium]|uniref:histidine kinase n=1 Tax=Eiseniibacteriota bacterium TaxID=2212470 RepID=A0A956NE95_UNCEI|nr:HAMP domain-containing protein [Candidatus Eisenbacteria bacterium]